MSINYLSLVLQRLLMIVQDYRIFQLWLKLLKKVILNVLKRMLLYVNSPMIFEKLLLLILSFHVLFFQNKMFHGGEILESLKQIKLKKF